MSSLRQRLTRPQTYLAILCLCLCAGLADSFREPSSQVTGRIYVGAVTVYQRFGRPLTSRFIKCRYTPTCSDYSLQAVQKHGIRSGLVLTYDRLRSCKATVALGTQDPVPPRTQTYR